MVIAVEKVRGKILGRAYGTVINQASTDCFRPFFEKHIDRYNTQVVTDDRKGY